MSADEFDVIRDLFAPLATSPAARGLRDDVAVLQASGELVVTTDALVEGVHFLPDDPIDLVAKKALRVNFSDLIAKGAKPSSVLLTLIWPRNRDASLIARFVEGFKADLSQFGVSLLGGDTTSTPGPLTVSITAFGKPLGTRTPARGDGKVGEDLWVTGTIGDALLGLMTFTDARQFAASMPTAQLEALTCEARMFGYWTPRIPQHFEAIISRFAQASTDVSDGLMADAGNIGRASRVRLRLDAATIPLSAPGRAFVAHYGTDGLARLVTGGDDYQALFTVPAEHREAIEAAACSVGVRVTRIGVVEAGEGAILVTSDGRAIETKAAGYSHKLGK